MKSTNDILQIVLRNLKNDAKRAMISQLEEDKSVRDEYLKLKNVWALISSTKPMSDSQVENLYLGFQQRLKTKQKLKLLNFSFLKYAAIFILAVALTSLFFISQPYRWNGKPYDTTVFAENGQVSKILLPDSSVVWLNSGTKITYNTDYAINNREIKLIGQAFFKAAKNKKVPMRVFCGNLEVKVLGTRFDVCAYPNEKTINVVLEAGKVEILNRTLESFNRELAPGEMAQYNYDSGELTTTKVNTGKFTSWKEGILVFRDDPMSEVILRLKRKYDINIEVMQPELYKSVFTATIKNENLEDIFKSIGYACSINYKIIRSEDINTKTKVILENIQHKKARN